MLSRELVVATWTCCVWRKHGSSQCYECRIIRQAKYAKTRKGAELKQCSNLRKDLYSTFAASRHLLTPMPSGLQSRRDVEDHHLVSACASSLSDARDKVSLLLHAQLLHPYGQQYLKRHPAKVCRTETSCQSRVDGQIADKLRACRGSSRT